jgi:photosystem II stability/assembly factor-like uncharacterized protein
MWERLTALEGGTVSGLTVVGEAEGRPIVLAVTPTGLFRSEDGGRSWAALGRDRALPLAQQVVASPDVARDNMLYCAAHDGLYRSEDGGRSWRQVLIGAVLTVALSPTFGEDRVLFVGTADDGVLRSEDGGTSWSGANAGLLDLAALTIAVSPRLVQDRTAFAGTATALYRSRNGGRSWREVELGLNEPAIQMLALSPRFEDDRLVLVGTEADGLLRSDDAGVNFEPVPELAGRGISALTISLDGRTIVVAAGTEALRSDDGGLTWHVLPEAPSLILSLALVSSEGGESVLAGLYREGAARLDGDAWQLSRSGLTARLLTSLTASPTFADDRMLFATSLDDGVLVSRDAGHSWTRAWPDDADPSVAALALSPAYSTDRTILASAGDEMLRSVDGGQTWGALPAEVAPLRVLAPLPGSGAGGFVGVAAGEVTGDRLQGTGEGGASLGGASPAPTVPVGAGLAPPARSDDAIVFSTDGGESWRPFWGRGLGNIAAIGAVAASPGYVKDRTLFVGGAEAYADGSVISRLWRSTDNGRTWLLWLEEAGGAGALLAGALLVPPSFARDGTLLLAVGRRVLTPVPNSWERRGGQRRPGWQAADLGPDVVAVTMLASAGDATRAPIVFAGTNAGPYVSRDGGRSFAAWSEGYDGGGIVGLAVSPAYATDRLVFAIGLGGTIWQRKDES